MKHLFVSGHRGCAGCCDAMAAKFTLMGAGEDCIVVSPTGCLEVMTTPFPETSWNVPWIHSLFENAAAVASGIEAALKAMGKKGNTRVVAIGGDGATMDIGLQAISGAFERGHDFTYVCIDNEAYMNTGGREVVEPHLMLQLLQVLPERFLLVTSALKRTCLLSSQHMVPHTWPPHPLRMART